MPGREDGRGVRADGEQPRLTERHLTSRAGDQCQRERQHSEDRDDRADAQQIIAAEQRQYEKGHHADRRQLPAPEAHRRARPEEVAGHRFVEAHAGRAEQAARQQPEDADQHAEGDQFARTAAENGHAETFSHAEQETADDRARQAA